MRFAPCPIGVGGVGFDLVERLDDLHVEFTPTAHVAIAAAYGETVDRRVKLFEAIGGAGVIGQHGNGELLSGKIHTRAPACNEHKMMDAAFFLDQPFSFLGQPMFAQGITHDVYGHAQHDRHHQEQCDHGEGDGTFGHSVVVSPISAR